MSLQSSTTALPALVLALRAGPANATSELLASDKDTPAHCVPTTGRRAPTRAVDVQPVSSRRELTRWIRFPYSIYPADGQWVPPLERELRRRLSPRNPYFRHGEARAFLALEQGRVRGRILAHVNRKHIEAHGERVAFFGYFECDDDPWVARGLFDAASSFAREHGCDRLRGPFNMTAYQELGILLQGFDRSHSVGETHTAPYYPRLLQAAGLQPCKHISTFLNPDLQQLDPQSLLGARFQQLPQQTEITVRTVDLRHYKREVLGLGQILNACFEGNWHYVPLSDDEVRFDYGGLKPVLRSDLVLVAEHHGEPVGFAICMPDVYQLLRPMRGRLSIRGLLRFQQGRDRLRQACLLTIGVRPEHRRGGVIRLLLHQLVHTLQRLGYTSLTGTWVGDDNEASLAQTRALGMVRKHRLAIYEGRVD